jgi:hypothetical protein
VFPPGRGRRSRQRPHAEHLECRPRPSPLHCHRLGRPTRQLHRYPSAEGPRKRQATHTHLAWQQIAPPRSLLGAGVSKRTEPSGNTGAYFSVLNAASLQGLSQDTGGRECDPVTPRSTSSWTSGLPCAGLAVRLRGVFAHGRGDLGVCAGGHGVPGPALPPLHGWAAGSVHRRHRTQTGAFVEQRAPGPGLDPCGRRTSPESSHHRGGVGGVRLSASGSDAAQCPQPASRTGQARGGRDGCVPGMPSFAETPTPTGLRPLVRRGRT